MVLYVCTKFSMFKPIFNASQILKNFVYSSMKKFIIHCNEYTMYAVYVILNSPIAVL